MMTNVNKYYKLHEVVCKHVLEQHGERAWKFFNPRLLETMVFVRELLGVPIYINNYGFGGTSTQRGARCCLCQIVKDKVKKNSAYISAHVTFSGVDFNAKDMTAEEVRRKIEEHKDELPYPIRLERDVTWVHLDVYDNESGEKIVYFNG